MTPADWLSHAHSEMRAEEKAGNSINTATAEVIRSLLGGWTESVLDDKISCGVVLHDLLEVASRLKSIHDDLKPKLPSVLDEMSEIIPDPNVEVMRMSSMKPEDMSGLPFRVPS